MSSFYDLFTQPRPAVVTPIDVARHEPPRQRVHPYAEGIRRAWLARLDALPRPWFHGAAWDHNSFVAARKLVELANSAWSGYDLGQARADYLAHAPYDHVWDKREKCWEQAVAYTGGAGLPEPDPLVGVPEATVLYAEAGLGEDTERTLRQLLPTLDFAELLTTEDDGEEWILEPLLPARRLVALYSAPKVGKSLLMLEVAVGIATGTPVLGVTPEPLRVLYVDFENDPRGDIKRRLQAMGWTGREHGERLNERLCYLSYPSLAKLDTAQGGAELMAAIAEYDCQVVVIDTVSRAVAGEENDNDTWLNFYRHTGLALKQHGVACLRLDHSGKDAEKGMRGGSAKYGDVDAVWRLTAASETVLELDCTDHRMPVEETHLTLVRESNPVLHHRVAGDRSIALNAKEKELDAALDRLGVPLSGSVRTARTALREAGLSFKNSVLERVVRARKMRLPQASPEVSPAPRGDASPEQVSPGPPLREGAGGTGRDEGGRSVEPVADRMFIVSCKACYRPVHRDQRDELGRCQTCATPTEIDDPEEESR